MSESQEVSVNRRLLYVAFAFATTLIWSTALRSKHTHIGGHSGSDFPQATDVATGKAGPKLRCVGFRSMALDSLFLS